MAPCLLWDTDFTDFYGLLIAPATASSSCGQGQISSISKISVQEGHGAGPFRGGRSGHDILGSQGLAAGIVPGLTIIAPPSIYTSNVDGRLVARSKTLDLLQGTLDLLVLKTLSWGPAHGYAIARWIQQLTGEVLVVGEGSLYPALHRLDERGWIESEWRLSENNRRAKFYRLTTAGRQQLRAEAVSWDRFVDAVGKVMRADGQPSS